MAREGLPMIYIVNITWNEWEKHSSETDGFLYNCDHALIIGQTDTKLRALSDIIGGFPPQNAAGTATIYTI